MDVPVADAAGRTAVGIPRSCGTRARSVAEPSPTVRSVSPSRPPRFLPFILTGAVIGFLGGALLSVTGQFEDPDAGVVQGTYAPSAGIGYVGLLGAGLCALLAALLALALDRWSRRD